MGTIIMMKKIEKKTKIDFDLFKEQFANRLGDSKDIFYATLKDAARLNLYNAFCKKYISNDSIWNLTVEEYINNYKEFLKAM